MEVLERQSLKIECCERGAYKRRGGGEMGNVLENKMTLGEARPWERWRSLGVTKELFEKEVV